MNARPEDSIESCGAATNAALVQAQYMATVSNILDRYYRRVMADWFPITVKLWLQ
jgi:hypothetical protein